MTKQDTTAINSREWAEAIAREYNGWTNYPTWNAFLWISNDEDSWNDFLGFGQTNPDAHDVAAYVKRYIRDTRASASAWADIQGWARNYGKSLYAAEQVIDYESIRAHLADAVNDAI